MKKLLLVIGILFILLVVLVLLLPFVVDLNSYQAQYLPLIEDALNRQVKLKDIRLTIFPRLGVRIAEFTVLDDPAFSHGPFAELASLDVSVKIGPLLEKRIEVQEITLRDPVITVIKNRQGVLNTSTLGKATAPKEQEQPVQPGSVEGPLRLLALLAVDRVSITGGELTYIDQSEEKPKEYVLEELELLLHSVRLGQTASLHIATTVHPLGLPVTVDGTFGPLEETLDVKAFHVDLGLGKSAFTIKGSAIGGKISAAITSPVINTAHLPITPPLTKPIQVNKLLVTANVTYPFRDGAAIQDVVEVERLELDLVLGNSVVTVEGSARDGQVKLFATSPAVETADLPFEIPLQKPFKATDLMVTAEMKNRRLRLPKLSLNLLGGHMVASGELKIGLTPAPFSGKASLQGIQLEQVLEAVGSHTIAVSGAAAAELTVKGKGFSKPDLASALRGAGHLVVSDGKIEGANLLNEAAALLQVVGVPLGSLNETVFSSVDADFVVNQGTIQIKRLFLESHDFQAMATGTIGFDQSLNIKADLHLSESVSRNLLSKSPVARLAMKSGRLTVPMLISGTTQSPSYALDLKAVGTRVKEQVKEKIGELLKGDGGPAEKLLQKGSEALRKLFGQ